MLSNSRFSTRDMTSEVGSLYKSIRAIWRTRRQSINRSEWFLLALPNTRPGNPLNRACSRFQRCRAMQSNSTRRSFCVPQGDMELKGSEARIQQPGSAVDWMPIVFHVCWVGASDVYYYGISMTNSLFTILQHKQASERRQLILSYLQYRWPTKLLLLGHTKIET